MDGPFFERGRFFADGLPRLGAPGPLGEKAAACGDAAFVSASLANGAKRSGTRNILEARGMAERGGDRDEVFSLGFGLILLLLILLRCYCCYCCCCTFCGFACGFCFLFDVFILVVYI
jgi:hypothetical protein